LCDLITSDEYEEHYKLQITLLAKFLNNHFNQMNSESFEHYSDYILYTFTCKFFDISNSWNSY